MSILLVLCVLGAAGWLVLSVLARDSGDDPGDSVAAHSRAMQALNPTGGTARSAVARPSSPRTGRSTSRRAPTHRRTRPASAGRRNRVSAR